MIKIDNFNLIGYKNVKKADLALSNFNVIIGPNNSGKSNFLQSISFLGFIINSSLDDLEKSFSEGLHSTYFNEIIPKNSIPDNHCITFNLKFSNTETNRTFTYHLDLEWSNINFDINYKIRSETLDFKDSSKPGKPINIFNRNGDAVKYGTEVAKMVNFKFVPSFLSVIRILKLIPGTTGYGDAISSLNTIIKTPTFYFSNIELTKPDSNNKLSVFNGRIVSFELEDEIIAIQKNDKKGIFDAAVKNILNIDSVKIESSLSKDTAILFETLLFEHFGCYKNLKDLSDGTILVIALITKVLYSENSIFFIEEPENSIHPKALVDLVSFLDSFSEVKQFIITSHSIALLNKTNFENIVTAFVYPDGGSELFNVTSRKELKRRLKQGYVNFSDELFFSDNEENEFE